MIGNILIVALILASTLPLTCTTCTLLVSATTEREFDNDSDNSMNNIIKQPEEYQQRLVDWIRAGKNGFFHPSVKWKRLGPDGSNSGPYAMHTLVDIKKGTPLLVVPRGYVIDSYQTYDACTTVARMLDEYENKQDDSLFAPYLSYLFDKKEGGTSNGLLPTSWTTTGKKILDHILDIDNSNDNDDDDDDDSDRDHDRYGRGLEPRNYEQPNVFEQCGPHFRGPLPEEPILQDKNDPKRLQRVQDAFLFHVSRSWTDKMVPVLDMYNHRNGHWLNVESTTAHDLSKDITAFASRDIQAGEQLQNSYSECMDEDCEYGEIKYTYLTQHIFKDYGFVELYPRRWRLGGLICEVDEDPMNSGEKTFKWIFDTPNKKNIEWLTHKLNRLQEIESKVRTKIDKHRRQKDMKSRNNDNDDDDDKMTFNIEHEADTLLELFEGYVEVLQLALEHQNDSVGLTYADHKKRVQQARDSMEVEL